MGEAKEKAKRREDHARKIVTAFEVLISAKILERVNAVDADTVNMARELLIRILVTPPPKS